LTHEPVRNLHAAARDLHAAATPLALVGMACLFPRSDGLEQYWRTLVEGVDAITEVPATHWSPDDYFDPDPKAPDHTYARRGGFLDPVDFDPLAFGIPPSALDVTDTAQLLGMVVAQRALADAGYAGDAARPFDRERASVILGVTGTLELSIPLGARLGHPRWRRALREAGVPDAVADEVVERIGETYVEWQEGAFPGLLGNVVAGRVANRLDLHGTNCVVDAACASTLGALHMAALELWAGRADMVLTGGVDTFNDIFMYMCFSKTPALSPTGDARPFDRRADGTILGEGVGMVVLKRLEDARRDGDRVYAVLRGLGTSSDGRGHAIYAPSADGQQRALARAYEQAGITPDTIELVEAHGTGTSVGDATEVEALSRVFRGARADGSWCALGSVKSQIGHTKAAAGVAGLIKAALALHHRVQPPTIKVEHPHDAVAPGATPFFVNTLKRPWLPRGPHPRRAALSAFGFGGSNFHCVLEEAGAPAPAVAWDGEVQIAPLGGPDAASLHAALDAWQPRLRQDPRGAARRAREAFDPASPARLVLVLHPSVTPDDLVLRAHALLDEPAARAPDVFLGRGAAPGRLAVLCPGQGSQRVGMLRDLACAFPRAAEAFALAERAAPADELPRLAEVVYPAPAFDAATREALEAALRDTRRAQPALGAAGLASWRVLEHFGVRPDAAAGHSFGELTALCVAGRITPDALAALAHARGRVLARADDGRGGMAAIAAGREEVEAALAELALPLVVANENAPRQLVLAGPREAVDAAVEAFTRRGVVARRLPVSAAFHAPLVEQASGPLADALASVEIVPGRLPVYANTTAARHPDEADAVRALLAEHVARPVRFADELRAMADDGLTTFVELGPGRTLTGLVDATLGDAVHALALDGSRGAEHGLVDLARALGRLAALGHGVDLTAWDADFVPPPAEEAPRLTVPVGGANVTTRPPRTRAPGPARAADPPAPPAPAAVPAASAPPVVPSATPPARASQPMSDPDPSSPPRLREALRVTQENIAALQRMQERAAHVHEQFLTGQRAATDALAALLAQQRALLAAPARGDEDEAPAAPAPPAPAREDGIAPAPPHAPATAPAPPDAPPVPAPPATAAAPPAVPDEASPPNGRARDNGHAEDALTATLLAVVAEKTGYPHDVLQLDMALDADLGIDSIKRVEILSALQDRLPEAPPVAPERLGTLRTLADVRAALAAVTGPAPAAPADAAAASDPAPPPDAPDPASATLARYEVEPSDPKADAAPRSAAFLPSGPLLVVPLDEADREPAAALAAALDAACAARLDGEPPPRPRVVDAVAEGAGPLAGLVLVAARARAGRAMLARALAAARAAAPRLPEGALLGVVTRLDGRWGLGGAPLDDPGRAALAALAKTAAREWPGVRCRALDVADPDATPHAIADALLLDGDVERGLAAGGVVRLRLVERPLPAGPADLPLTGGDLVLVSGGGRGVTAEAAVALAARVPARFALLGRTPGPIPEVSDGAPPPSEEHLVREEIERARAGGEAPDLAAARERARTRRARHEIGRTLARLRARGAAAEHHAVDVRDADAVRALVADLAARHGPVRGLVHGAGVLADQLIADKTDAAFARVLSTKVDGLAHLLEAIDPATLRALAVFSSTTALLGRRGQVDYAMANAQLEAIARDHARRHPHTAVRAVGWGPWDGGMVDEALAGVFEREGIALIPPAAGGAHLADTLAAPHAPVVSVVLGAGGTLPPEDPAHAVARWTVDVASLPALADHVLDGRAVVPFAWHVEWMAQAARAAHPARALLGLRDVALLRGLVLEHDARTRIEVRVGPASPEGLVDVELASRGADGGRSVHARARVEGARERAEAEPPARVACPREAATVYEEVLFHGPRFRSLTSVSTSCERGIVGLARGAPAPRAWMPVGARAPWATDPMLVDAAWQLLIVWCADRLGARCLPARLGRLEQHRAPAGGSHQVDVRVREAGERRLVADVAIHDERGRLVCRLEALEATVAPGLSRAFARRRLETPA